MSKFTLNGINAADTILSYFHDVVRANPDASPLRSFSSYLKAKGIDTLFVRVHPTSVPRRIVIASISMATKVMGKGTFTALHQRLADFARIEDFIIEYENVLTARFQRWFAENEPLAFIDGHTHEYERDLLAREKLKLYAESEKANPESNWSPRSINIACPQTFSQWMRHVIQRAVNAPKAPINPLYYNGGTSQIDPKYRWPGDLDCMLTLLSEFGQRARVLVVHGVPADVDLPAMRDAVLATTFRPQYEGLDVPARMFVTLYRTDGYGYQLDLNIKN